MLQRCEVDSLRRPTADASGLPRYAYTSEEFAQEEYQNLFARTWTFAGFAHELSQSGDVVPRTVAGVPLVFVRTRSQEIRCFHNVCSHRGTLLVPDPVRNQQAIRCRYHGWTFDLDGCLRMTPHWSGYNKPETGELDRRCFDLTPVRLARWHDWLFVNVDGTAEPFEEYAKPFLRHCREYDLDKATWCRTIHYEINANWKLVAENYLETLHLNFVHSILAEVAPFEQHTVVADDACLGTIIDVGLPASWTEREPLPRWPGISGDNRTAKNLALFPNFKFIIGPDHCASMVEFPSGAEKSHQRWDFYFHDGAGDDPRFSAQCDAIIDFFDTTNVEDFDIVEAVHAGHKSPAMGGARFNGIWEGGVHHFQKLVASYMTV